MMGQGMNTNNCRGVGMKQCAATNSLDPVRWVWSGGAADCVIVAAYGQGRAFIVHADAMTDDADWLQKLSELMKGVKTVTVWMVSEAVGNNPNSKTISRVREVLNRYEAKWNIQPEINSRMFAVDARTGQTEQAFNTVGLPMANINAGLEVEVIYWQPGGGGKSATLKALID